MLYWCNTVPAVPLFKSEATQVSKCREVPLDTLCYGINFRNFFLPFYPISIGSSWKKMGVPWEKKKNTAKTRGRLWVILKSRDHLVFLNIWIFYKLVISGFSALKYLSKMFYVICWQMILTFTFHLIYLPARTIHFRGITCFLCKDFISSHLGIWWNLFLSSPSPSESWQASDQM